MINRNVKSKKKNYEGYYSDVTESEKNSNIKNTYKFRLKKSMEELKIVQKQNVKILVKFLLKSIFHKDNNKMAIFWIHYYLIQFQAVDLVVLQNIRWL